jgi:hypothetical protein
MASVYGMATLLYVSPGGWATVMAVVKEYTLPLTRVGAMAAVSPFWLVTVGVVL